MSLWFWVSTLVPSLALGVVQCRDARGNTIFTDNKALCAAGAAARAHSLQPAGKAAAVPAGAVNFRYPRREYAVLSGSWTVYYETGLKAGLALHARPSCAAVDLF